MSDMLKYMTFNAFAFTLPNDSTRRVYLEWNKSGGMRAELQAKSVEGKWMTLEQQQCAGESQAWAMAEQYWSMADGQ